jgi:ribosomal protein S18 acetylase RimI-like enzyme
MGRGNAPDSTDSKKTGSTAVNGQADDRQSEKTSHIHGLRNIAADRSLHSAEWAHYCYLDHTMTQKSKSSGNSALPTSTAREIRIRECNTDNIQDRETLLSLIRELQAHECHLFDRMKSPEELGDEYVQNLEKECQEQEGYILFAEKEEADAEVCCGDGGELSLRTTRPHAAAAAAALVVGYAVVVTKVPSTPEHPEEVSYLYGNLLEIAVTASARGRGIGRQLLLACEQRVREAGVSYFRTSVLASNPMAYQMYHTFGMKDHLIEMEKKLA